jgi:hypothetical protein
MPSDNCIKLDRSGCLLRVTGPTSSSTMLCQWPNDGADCPLVLLPAPDSVIGAPVYGRNARWLSSW